MTLKEQIKGQMKEAMRAKDKLALETIRGLLSAIQYEEMNKKVDDLTDDQVLAVLKAEQKKLAETKEFAEKDGRADAVEETDKRIAVVASFLPSQLERDQIEKIISDFSSSADNVNVGSIMKHLKENYSGQYDGKVASELAKQALGS